MSDKLFEIHDDQTDVDEIMARIQERARRRSDALPLGAGAAAWGPGTGIPLAPYPSPEDRRNLDVLNASFDPEAAVPPSTRLRTLKNIVLWAARPLSRAQTAFNAAATALLGRHGEQIDALTQAVTTLERMVGDDSRPESLASRLAHIEKALDDFCVKLTGRQEGMEGRPCLEAAADRIGTLAERERELGHRHELLRQEVLAQKRRLEVILREVRQKAVIDRQASGELRKQEERLSDHYFVLQGDRFRGTDEEIRERVAVHVPVFAERQKQAGGDAYVLDIGCGVGTLLELLRDAGVPARGVEQNEELAQVCRDKGLEVSVADGLAALRAAPDGSLLGVAAIHVVEHLATDELLEFIKLCHQKIKRGGALILETPNPTNLVVGAAEFWLDLTHMRPIHPLTLSHLVESLGFAEVALRNLHPAEAELQLRLTSGGNADLQTENENWARLNGLLFGPRDYAVIAIR